MADLPTVASAKTMSWEEVWCRRNGCTPRQFRRRLFWLVLHRHAVPLAPLLLLGNLFAADRELIDGCARARSMRQVVEEIEYHRSHPLNRGWLRRALRLRISTHRIRRLAREYLPGSALPPPFTSG